MKSLHCQIFICCCCFTPFTEMLRIQNNNKLDSVDWLTQPLSLVQNYWAARARAARYWLDSWSFFLNFMILTYLFANDESSNFFNSWTKLWPIERACPDSSFLGGKWKSSGKKLRMVDKMDQKKMERVQMVMTFIYFNTNSLNPSNASGISYFLTKFISHCGGLPNST